MDNVCHTLAGAALARAGFDRVSPLAMPTLLIASNLPDADIVASYWGSLAYLVHHRGVTHSWVGIVALALILACVMYGVGALLARRDPNLQRPRYWRLVGLSALGLSVHLLLDYTNAYGVRPHEPFDDTWYYGDLVFIVDPWLWILLGAALWLGASQRIRTNLAYGAIFGVMTLGLLVGTRSGQAPGSGGLVVWIVGLAVIVGLRVRYGGEFRRVWARVALALVVVYWTALAALHSLAIERVRQSDDLAGLESVPRVSAIPTPIYPSRWRVLVESPGRIAEFGVDALDGTVVPTATYERNLETPEANAALASCAGRVAHWFNRFLIADISSGADGTTTVTLRDIRFPQNGPRGVAHTPVVLGPNLEAVETNELCPGR